MKHPQLLISDYAGHPFTYELANDLNEIGHETAYSYCAATVSPRADFEGRTRPLPVGLGWRFEKYQPLRRVFSELRYGVGLGRVARRVRPQRHVLVNMPVISGLVAWLMTRTQRTPTIVWFQDVQSGIASGTLGTGFAARLFSRLETALLRVATQVVAISATLEIEARRRGVPAHRVSLMENWAPLDRLPVWTHDTPWAREHQVAQRPVFLYSGTLGRKHDPSILLSLARAIRERGGQVIAITEGEGAEWLREQATTAQVENLRIMPYQPFDRLAEVLASADVLVALLEPSAGEFSVPSKTLSYLCAARPILASIPPENDAAKLVQHRARAGVVTPPGDHELFLENAVRLASDPSLRTAYGAAARSYAERHFQPAQIVQRFIDAVGGSGSAGTSSTFQVSSHPLPKASDRGR